MKLITTEIEKKLRKNPLHSTDGKPDAEREVLVKFFIPWSAGTWFVLEAQEENDDWLFFGLVHVHETEFGYFRLSELKSVKGPYGLKVERDLHWIGTLADAREFLDPPA